MRVSLLAPTSGRKSYMHTREDLVNIVLSTQEFVKYQVHYWASGHKLYSSPIFAVHLSQPVSKLEGLS